MASCKRNILMIPAFFAAGVVSVWTFEESDGSVDSTACDAFSQKNPKEKENRAHERSCIASSYGDDEESASTENPSVSIIPTSSASGTTWAEPAVVVIGNEPASRTALHRLAPKQSPPHA